LSLHQDKTKIFSARKGLTFLGFYLSRGVRRISAQAMRRQRSRLKKFRYWAGRGEIEQADIVDSLSCWKAHSRWADASALCQQMAFEEAVWSDAVPAVLLS
jgi:hypothetical protein